MFVLLASRQDPIHALIGRNKPILKAGSYATALAPLGLWGIYNTFLMTPVLWQTLATVSGIEIIRERIFGQHGRDFPTANKTRRVTRTQRRDYTEDEDILEMTSEALAVLPSVQLIWKLRPIQT